MNKKLTTGTFEQSVPTVSQVSQCLENLDLTVTKRTDPRRHKGEAQ